MSSESLPLEKVATKNLDALARVFARLRAHAVGHLKEAIALFRQAVKLDPGFARAHTEIGQALSDMGDPAAAQEEYRMAARSRDRLASRDVLYIEALAGASVLQAPRSRNGNS